MSPLRKPPCRRTGRHCLELSVRLRVATLEGDAASADHEATWLLGHRERIHFGRLETSGQSLYTEAVLAIPCRFASRHGTSVRCRAHGFRGRVVPRVRKPVSPQLGDGEFEYVSRGRLTHGPLRPDPAPRRTLPVFNPANPCATARCRTADGTIGAACCRDLQLEILCRPTNRRLESLIRARKPPFLCKTERESPDSLGVEVISACGYLESGGVLCSLHGRRRPDGRTAKPDLCFNWPSPGDQYHRDCALKPHP